MNTLNWIFFISSAIGFLMSIGASIIYMYDDDFNDFDEFIIGIGLNFVTLLTVGLIFYTTLNIFQFSVSIIIFKITLFISIIESSLFLFFIFKNGYKPNWVSKVLVITILSLTIFILFISFDLHTNINESVPSLTIKMHTNYLYTSKITFIVFSILAFILLLMYYWKFKRKFNRKQKNQKELDFLIDDMYYDLNEFKKSSSNTDLKNDSEDYYKLTLNRFEDKLRRIDIDNSLKIKISKNLRRILMSKYKVPSSRWELKAVLLNDRSYDDIRSDSNVDSSGYLLEEMSERLQSIIRKEFKNNFSKIYLEQNNEFGEIKTLIQRVNEIKVAVDKKTPNKDLILTQKPDYSSQKVFIRELYHYLMTPLSQINAASITLETLVNSKSKDIKIKRNLNAIKAGVDLCQSVLTAYRQLAFIAYNSNEEDRISILDGIKSAELLYQESSNKSLKIDHLDILESIKGYSNNFILSILLPLIENSINASKENSTFSIQYIENEKSYSFILTNTTKVPVNIKNLYLEGYSSKKNHEGTGLSTVRNLINNVNDSSLEFEKKNSKLITKLSLPKYEN